MNQDYNYRRFEEFLVPFREECIQYNHLCSTSADDSERLACEERIRAMLPDAIHTVLSFAVRLSDEKVKEFGDYFDFSRNEPDIDIAQHKLDAFFAEQRGRLNDRLIENTDFQVITRQLFDSIAEKPFAPSKETGDALLDPFFDKLMPLYLQIAQELEAENAQKTQKKARVRKIAYGAALTGAAVAGSVATWWGCKEKPAAKAEKPLPAATAPTDTPKISAVEKLEKEQLKPLTDGKESRSK